MRRRHCSVCKLRLPIIQLRSPAPRAASGCRNLSKAQDSCSVFMLNFLLVVAIAKMCPQAELVGLTTVARTGLTNKAMVSFPRAQGRASHCEAAAKVRRGTGGRLAMHGMHHKYCTCGTYIHVQACCPTANVKRCESAYLVTSHYLRAVICGKRYSRYISITMTHLKPSIAQLEERGTVMVT